MNKPSPRRSVLHARRMAGFTLIELMIAMILGLIVIAGVTSVFLAGQQSFRTNNALADVQDGSRIAFELMARDIREAGEYGCDSSTNRVANVIQPGGAPPWYADWNNALHGYDNASSIDDKALPTSGSGAAVIGQDSVHLIGAGSLDASVSGAPSSDAANLRINAASPDLNIGDIIIVCSFSGTDPHATILQITGYNGNTVVIHNTGNKVSPGNCSKGLGYPTDCSTNGNSYVFPPNSPIAKLSGTDWYIGTNPTGGSSLYRLTLQNNGDGSGVTVTPQEMVRNVTSMKIKYLAQGASGYVDASSITDWSTVDSVQVTLTLASTFQRAGTDAKPISRTYTATTTVRNRVD